MTQCNKDTVYGCPSAAAGECDEHEPFENLDCPSSCAEEHPEPERDFVFECPATGDRWVYCDPCGGWQEAARWQGDPTHIEGDYYCDPWEHNWRQCGDCEDWVHCDDASYNERRGLDLCRYCYEESGGDYGHAGQFLPTASCCGTRTVHFCELSERYVCDCKAADLRARKFPVLMAAAA